MKKFRQLMLSLCIGTLALVGCGSNEQAITNPEPTQVIELTAPDTTDGYRTFTLNSNQYSILLPDTWIQDLDNQDILVADFDEDHKLTVMVERYPLSEVSVDMEGTDLDAFIKLYEAKGIPKLLEMATTSEMTEFTTDNLVAAKGYELLFEGEDFTNKGYFIYAQTDQAFYSMSISGNGDVYDANIQDLMYLPATLTEIN